MWNLLLICAAIFFAGAGSANSWQLQQQEDPITKEKQFAAFHRASNWDSNYRYARNDIPEIVLICRNKKLEAYIAWEPLISCGKIKVEYRLPDGKVVNSTWSGATDCKANFIPNPKAFMKSLGAGGEVPIRYTPRSGAITVVTFQFKNPTAAKDSMPQWCRW